MGLWGILCFLIFLGKSWGQEQTYVISAPKVFRVGASENIVIQVYGYTEEFDATISIKSFPDKKVTYSSGHVTLSTENKFQNSATLTIAPKQLSERQSSVSHVYLEVISKHFSKAKKMPITYDNGFLFIHTDKPVYTPHQSVKVRVYSLNDDLKPAKRETVLTFIDPEGSEVYMVEENDYTGIISFPDFKIPSNPKYGVWTIQAKYKEDFSTTGTAYFEIKEYVLPHFSISIEPESNFIGYKDFTSFEITIRARYFYNKVVNEADVYISFGIRDNLKDNQKEMMQKAMQSTTLINGMAQVTFNSETAVKELSYESLEDLNDKYLYIGVTIIESTGGFSEEAEIPGIKYVLSPYKLNLVATPLFVKPGIPYSVKVQVKDSFDHLVGGIPVTLSAKTLDVNQETSDLESKKSVTRSSDGVASFVVNLPSEVTVLEFNVKTNDPDLPDENQASKDYRAIAYSSLSQSYLYIDWTENYKHLLVGEHLNIVVTPRSPYIDKITHYNYLVLSKGKIVHFGTRDKLSDSAYQSINIPVTQNMVPSARLLVYYIVTGEQTAELVSDSVWLNIEEKCGNQLEVHLSPSTDTYSPGQRVSLNMETELDSWVALTAVDSAIYGVQRTAKRPLERVKWCVVSVTGVALCSASQTGALRVFQTLEKSDLGCGAGGGRDNADVFYLAGLTFLTNANADNTQENDEPCKEILRPKRMLQKKIEEEAAKYQHIRVKKCCYDGAHRNDYETCEQRAARITIGPRCVKAFKECCAIATQFRAEESHKNIQLGRLHIKSLLPVTKPEIRSYFPESWLWEVHHVPKRNKLQFVLPDSLTTWEIQGVGISNSGICVANTLKAKVFKSVFLEMNIPYSVVRGEQIQLSGTVYNYRTSGIQFCVKMHPVEGICSSGSPGIDPQGRRFPKCVPQRIEGSSTHLVTFTVLPLDTGLHNISFSLETSVGNEILVKTLRVVPEGVKRESYAGVTLDPQGIYGTITRRKEFPYRIPLDMVPKTKVKRTVSIKGLLIGEIMSAVLSQEGIDILTHLPKGNAEAELMSVVPVFYVYHYLEAGNNWNIFSTNSLTQKQNLKTKLKEGMVSIMSFRNADYSYSMWKGGSASTWLTAFALRVLGQISKYVDQNQNSICNSLLWLLEKCQLENGSFKENSDYQPVKLQGTLPVEAQEKTLYLTAFAVIGIRKSFDICPLEKISTAVSKADNFLHENALSTQSAFTLAIAAYALSLGDKAHPQFRSIVSALKKKAFVKGNPPIYRFWKDDLQQKDSSAPSTGTARMVETTAYALLTSLNLKDMNYVNPVIKWLSEEQRYGGGFYSTQDTINAIEGLTEYSLLVRKLHLNMDIKVSYKNKGDLYHYKISEKYFLGRPIEVPLNDDLVILTTGQNSGLATVHVKTVTHKISTSEEVCSFHLKIETQEIEASSYSSSEYKRIVACASYKLGSEESSSGSSHAVMDISLPTGVSANPEDLKALVERVDQLLTDYEIKDGHVILQLNSIPSDEFLCVRFRIIELFEVGFLSPATFTVYEYHRPDKQCTMFYSTSYTKLQKVCEGVTCKCIEADCGQMQAELDLTISAATRKETACKPEIAYAYKVEIIAVTEENAFVKYTATLLDIFKAGLCLSRASASVLNLNCSLILLPVCRTLLAYLRGSQKVPSRRTRRLLDKSRTFHITCGVTICIFSGVHVAAHLVNALNFSVNYREDFVELNAARYREEDPRKLLFTTVPGLTGVCMVLVLFLMITASTYAIRVSNYDIFWYTHNLFFVFYMLLMLHVSGGLLKYQTNLDTHPPGCMNLNGTHYQNTHLPEHFSEHFHESFPGGFSKSDELTQNTFVKICMEEPRFQANFPQTWLWISGPLCLYCAERLYRCIRSNKPVTIISVTSHPSDVMEIRMVKENFKARPGQYIILHCPSVSALENHPFTLTMCPTETKATFGVHLKIVGDWTERFRDLLLPPSSQDSEILPFIQSRNYPKLYIDGPFGSPFEESLNYEVSLCVAGGIGVTPFASILNTLLDDWKPYKLRRLYFIWVCRDIQSFCWFADLLCVLYNKFWQENRPDYVNIQLYLSQTDGIQKIIGEKYQALNSRLFIGRPRWKLLFDEIAKCNRGKTVGVFCCGPNSISKTLHKLSNQNNSYGTRFEYNKESFS